MKKNGKPLYQRPHTTKLDIFKSVPLFPTKLQNPTFLYILPMHAYIIEINMNLSHSYSHIVSLSKQE